MEWIVRTLSLPTRLAPFLEERLLAAGFTRLSSERTPGERRLRLRIFCEPSGLLPSLEDLSAWIAEAEAAGLPGARLRVEDETLAERDWNAGFRAHFGPRKLLPGLSILPPWDARGPIHRRGEPMPGPAVELAIVIEPALAFGTGEHPTTRICLEALRDFASQQAASGGGPFDCLDVGSGTGILTIAAKLWGADRAEGYDIDRRAILNAYLNAELNGLAGRVRFRWGELKAHGSRDWDIILCNLYLTPILSVLPRLGRRLKPGGTAILSGFLEAQETKIAEAARRRGWTLRQRIQREGWILQRWETDRAASGSS